MSDDLSELIARVEALEGADREVDARLWWALRRPEAERCYWNGAMGMPKPMPPDAPMPSSGLGYAGMKAMAPAYTESLDAALALVERCLPPEPKGWMKTLYITPEGAEAELEPLRSTFLSGGGSGMVCAPTPALALTLALLRALAVKEKDRGE